MKQNFIPILDNGHGAETAGKRSPVWDDGTQLFEWEFNRDIVKRVSSMLEEEGIQYRILVPETKDVSLSARCKRANAIYSETSGKCFLISVHANAGGGTGWEAYTYVGQTKADLIATELYKEAEKEFAPDGWKIRKDTSDGDPDKESQFYILKHTKCPAVLSENFFFDNEKDCKYMLNNEFRNRIAKIHCLAIKKII